MLELISQKKDFFHAIKLNFHGKRTSFSQFSLCFAENTGINGKKRQDPRERETEIGDPGAKLAKKDIFLAKKIQSLCDRGPKTSRDYTSIFEKTVRLLASDYVAKILDLKPTSRREEIRRSRYMGLWNRNECS
jgi:hypothetical protein